MIMNYEYLLVAFGDIASLIDRNSFTTHSSYSLILLFNSAQ